jgi:hypothetical protein
MMIRGYAISARIIAMIVGVILLIAAVGLFVKSCDNRRSRAAQSRVEGVAGAPLPDGDTVGDWVAFADQQTGKLDIANDRTKASIGIIERCEQRDAQAVKRATRGFWGRLFG